MQQVVETSAEVGFNVSVMVKKERIWSLKHKMNNVEAGKRAGQDLCVRLDLISRNSLYVTTHLSEGNSEKCRIAADSTNTRRDVSKMRICRNFISSFNFYDL